MNQLWARIVFGLAALLIVLPPLAEFAGATRRREWPGAAVAVDAGAWLLVGAILLVWLADLASGAWP